MWVDFENKFRAVCDEFQRKNGKLNLNFVTKFKEKFIEIYCQSPRSWFLDNNMVIKNDGSE